MFLDKHNIKKAIGPVDASGAAEVGARVSIKENNKITILVDFGTSATGALSKVKFLQHTALVGGVSKKLVVKAPYFKKVGAATKFTKVIPTAEVVLDTDYEINLSTDLDTASGVVVFEIDDCDLDSNGAFTHISVDLADTVNAKLVSVVYILGDNDQNPPYSKDI